MSTPVLCIPWVVFIPLSAFILLPGTYRQLRNVISAKDIPLTFTPIFSDTEHECNALMENVYPKLREFCQKKGYEFQVMSPVLFKVIKFKVP